MKNKLKKLLKLFVMTTISHPEEYYQKGLKSVGVDFANATHEQISAWKSIVKSIEADFLIHEAFTANPYPKEKIEQTQDALYQMTDKRT